MVLFACIIGYRYHNSVDLSSTYLTQNVKVKAPMYIYSFVFSELCCCTFDVFDTARKSYGTDEDLLFIYSNY